MNDLDRFAREAYDNGIHPIDHAVMRLETAFEIYAHEQIVTPREIAGYTLAELLNAGWTPPGDIFPSTLPPEESK